MKFSIVCEMQFNFHTEIPFVEKYFVIELCQLHTHNNALPGLEINDTSLRPRMNASQWLLQAEC